MIPIHRGREPGELRPVREVELARVRPHYTAGTLTGDVLKRRYEEVRQHLNTAQHGKCCYCERNNLTAAYHPVEHFRPKARALRGAGFPDHGYWWLTWTWSNLLFACPLCNSTHKRDRFPLESRSIALVPEESPPGLEVPLLIDPSRENPFPFIQFQLVPRSGNPIWMPRPRPGGPIRRAQETITVLGLDCPELLTLYNERHVRRELMPVVQDLNAAIAAANPGRVHEIWHERTLPRLEPWSPFTALSYDVFDHYFPRGVRRRWGLPLRQPR